MDCKEIRKELKEWIKGKIPFSERTRKHLIECFDCQDALRREDPISQFLMKVEFKPPPFLFERIRRRIKEKEKISIIRKWVLVPLIPAMALFISLFLFKIKPVYEKEKITRYIVQEGDMYELRYIREKIKNPVSDIALTGLTLSGKK